MIQVNKELIVRSGSNAVDFALTKDGKLIELHKEEDNNNFSVGDIFLAKVRKPVTGLNAAFVDVGYEKDAFLHYHDLGPQLSSMLKFVKSASTGKLKDFSLKDFPFEKAKALLMQSVFIQEYEMVDCELASSKCSYYLTAPISDEAKRKVVSQIPNKVTSEVFKSSLKSRQAIAQNVSEIPMELKEDYESLLDDKSYLTIESALYHLWVNFPESREGYLVEKEGVVGLSDKNVRLL